MSPAGLHLTPLGQGRCLLEPGRGLDISQRPLLIEDILERLQRSGAAVLYYDLGELPLIDEAYYAWLDTLARACAALNVRMICMRMQPTAAFGLSHYLKEGPAFETTLGLCV